MAFFDHGFEAQIGIFDWGRMVYTVIYVPDAVTDALPMESHPRLRIVGEIGEWPFEGALQPTGEGWYILLSNRFLKDSGLARGDEVSVQFNVADQEAVVVPPELIGALAEDDNASDLWDELTPGKQRGYAYHVSSAKTEPTRVKRAARVVADLFDPTLFRKR
ncbi:MAG: YdeI/OmpD-associated family protein [Pseudomonadota bacterium]